MVSVLLPLLLLQLAPPPPGPPGLQWIVGGRTRVGMSVGEVERIIDGDPETRAYAGALIGGTPLHDVAVESFWLMPTEVTCEQYAAYLLATGARAPEPWCETAIRAASIEHARTTAARAEEALKHDLPVPEAEPFDAHAWWLANGRGAGFELAPYERTLPVVSVDWDEARAYARWAGLRLATEAEHARAVRGDSERPWPWGDDVRAERFASTQEVARDGSARPVASFPGGKSRQDVYDLAGNVWEWTSDAYTSFPHYEPHEWVFGWGEAKQRVTAIAAFDAQQRVAVGGSFQMPLTLCRSGIRRGLTRDQRALALGLRCAASPRAGADVAATMNAEELSPARRPKGAPPLPRAVPDLTVAVDGWRTIPSQPTEGWTQPSGYTVIADYRCIAFAPSERVPVRDPQTLDRQSLENGPVLLGYLHTTVPLVQPELGPGTYLVCWRAKGLRKMGGDGPRSPDPPLEETLRFDIERDQLIVFDLDGHPLAAVPATMSWGPERDGKAAFTPQPDDREDRRSIHFEAYAPSETSKRGPFVAFDVIATDAQPGVRWR